MKFRYFLGDSVSLEVTLGDYCLDQASSSSPGLGKLGYGPRALTEIKTPTVNEAEDLFIAHH